MFVADVGLLWLLLVVLVIVAIVYLLKRI